MRRSKRLRTQPRRPGQTRAPMSTAVTASIERAISREMARYGVSRSFVIAVAVAHALDVNLYKDEEY